MSEFNYEKTNKESRESTLIREIKHSKNNEAEEFFFVTH